MSSDIPIAAPAATGTADISIRLHHESAPWKATGRAIAGPPEGFYGLHEIGENFLLNYPTIAQFVIRHALDTVDVYLVPGGDEALLGILVSGTLLGVVLGMRKIPTLHAAGVRTPAGVMLLAGPSGAGKSTLTAKLCLDGAQFVTDDLARVDSTTLECWPGGNEIRLRAQAAALGERLGPTHLTADSRIAAWVDPAGPHRVASVVFPKPDKEAVDLSVRRLDPMTAMLALQAVPRVLGWQLEGPRAAQFLLAGALVRSVPVFDVTIPWGLPALEAVDLLSAINTEAAAQ